MDEEEEWPETWDRNKVYMYTDPTGIKVPVPYGFTASGVESEKYVNTGLVIYEGEIEALNSEEWTEEEAWQASLDKNQFVWIPVENASERIYESNGENNPKKARLYNFIGSNITNSNGSKNEPSIIRTPKYDNKLQILSFLGFQDNSKDSLYKILQIDFDSCMNSIEKYGGFYIGRYETGNISQESPVVRRMSTDIWCQNWYTMYNRMKNISNNENIYTSMIWGCLWDETLRWLVDTGDKSLNDVAYSSTSWGNFYRTSFTYRTTSGSTATKQASKRTRIPTGSSDRNKANNIYDLAGNVLEWTLEVQSNGRMGRGGAYTDDAASSSYVGYRGGINYYESYPTWNNNGGGAGYFTGYGFRAILYIR